MNKPRPPVKVTIFGNDYTIRGEADENYIQQLAAYVNDKMNEIAGGTNLSNSLKISILAAINLADEVFRLRKTQHDSSQSPQSVALPLDEPSGIAPEAITALSAHIEAALNQEPQE